MPSSRADASVRAAKSWRWLCLMQTARDIGGCDPERMCARHVAECVRFLLYFVRRMADAMCRYIRESLANTEVKVSFAPQDHASLKKDYPLVAAVARASFVRLRKHIAPTHTPQICVYADLGRSV